MTDNPAPDIVNRLALLRDDLLSNVPAEDIATLTDAIAEIERLRGAADGRAFPEAAIKHMVDRFLGWPLPKDFRPDGGISFEPLGNRGTPHQYERMPSGTNLLDATQAAAMVRYMVEGLPAADGRGEVGAAGEVVNGYRVGWYWLHINRKDDNWPHGWIVARWLGYGWSHPGVMYCGPDGLERDALDPNAGPYATLGPYMGTEPPASPAQQESDNG